MIYEVNLNTFLWQIIVSFALIGQQITSAPLTVFPTFCLFFEALEFKMCPPGNRFLSTPVILNVLNK